MFCPAEVLSALAPSGTQSTSRGVGVCHTGNGSGAARSSGAAYSPVPSCPPFGEATMKPRLARQTDPTDRSALNLLVEPRGVEPLTS
jgi:hypothetical protein